MKNWGRQSLKKPVTLVASSAFILSACASHPDSIEPAYVSPSLYYNWSCEELSEERARLTSHVERVAGEQANAHGGDAALMTVGVIIFWPALIGLAATDDQEQELSRLRGEYEAVDQAMTRNRCSLPSPSQQQPPASSPSGQTPAPAPAPTATGEAAEIRDEYDSRIRALESSCPLEDGCSAAIQSLQQERDQRLSELSQ